VFEFFEEALDEVALPVEFDAVGARQLAIALGRVTASAPPVAMLSSN
jgi:hypothetical protein